LIVTITLLVPGITLKCENYLESKDTLVVELDTDGKIYLVPAGTLAIKDSMDNNYTLISSISANQEIKIPLNSIQKGEYIVYGMDTNYESFSIPLQLFVSQSSNNLTLNTKGYKLFPNPTDNIINIETQYQIPLTIEIHSLSGQIIQSTKILNNSTQIDLSSFQKGVYFITVRSRDLVRTEKIIKL